MQQEETTVPKRGGARPGAGRKKLNKSVLYTSINTDTLLKLKARAKKENLNVGDWLTKHLDI